MKVAEVSCKSALSKSNLADYAVNPYRGCQHRCIYCFAPSVLKEDREWGSFVDVRYNLPYILRKEASRKIKGRVILSSVTDPYQPIEKKYELTRNSLMVLKRHRFPLTILTKSSLLLRDMDIMADIPDLEVGVTITTSDEQLRKSIEPFASPVSERLRVLEECSSAGIKTWAFVGPILPYLTDIGPIVDKVSSAGASKVYFDSLRLKKGMWEKLVQFLKRHDPDLLPRYRDILFGDDRYFLEAFKDAEKICRLKGIEFSY